MITCPWCGTQYDRFQPNCKNCGGPLPLPDSAPAHVPSVAPMPAHSAMAMPPLPASTPRPVPESYLWKSMWSDGAAVSGFVLTLLGVIFASVGFMLTALVVTAFVGIPFCGAAAIMAGAGVPILIMQYNAARQRLMIQQVGPAVLGRITDVRPNYKVRVNGSYPWQISYQYDVTGQSYQGKVSFLNQLAPHHRAGNEVYVLYDAQNPQLSTLDGIY